MPCFDVLWHHDHQDEPVRLVSEVGTDGFEVRKLEFFRDGRVGFAFGTREFLGTALGEMPLPSVEAINADPQFSGKLIAIEEFERLWRVHGPQHE